jgi:hypothetical protein
LIKIQLTAALTLLPGIDWDIGKRSLTAVIKETTAPN